MLLNLTDILTSEGKVIKEQVLLEMEHFQSQLGEFQIVEKEPVTLTIMNTAKGKAHVEGETSVTLLMKCDRCLKDVNRKISISFVRDVTAPTEEYAEDEEDTELCMEGYQLNVDVLVTGEILINWPMKVLCKKDCKGICSVCGKDLNDGDCGCDTFVPDPRMAMIKDIFNANKEV